MSKNENPKKTERRKALKTLKFWFKALLASELMDDKQHRLEFMEALQILKKRKKKEVV